MKRLRGSRYTLFFSMVSLVFVVQVVTLLLAAIGVIVLMKLDVIRKPLPMMGFGAVGLTSLTIGTALSVFGMKTMTKPFLKLVAATNEITAGNYGVRVDLHGTREAEALAVSFNKMAAELSGIESLRSDFIRNVAHEFKTPVASIKGFAKLLRKDSLATESRNEYIDIIIRESDRLSQLSSNVLLLSKLENQEIETEREKFLLDEQLRRVLLMLEPEWKKKHITVTADLEVCSLTVSEELMAQVWINLIGNAIKFTPDGGEVSVTLRASPSPFVCVKDNGAGMSEETLRHIFEKFYQSDASRSTAGNGLGLPLVKRILEMIGGNIEITSEAGVGTETVVIL